jgi:hypothetical protein
MCRECLRDPSWADRVQCSRVKVRRPLLTVPSTLSTGPIGIRTEPFTLSTTHYSPLTTHHSPLTTRHSPLTLHAPRTNQPPPTHQDHFIFSVESTGILPPEFLVHETIQVLLNKA